MRPCSGRSYGPVKESLPDPVAVCLTKRRLAEWVVSANWMREHGSDVGLGSPQAATSRGIGTFASLPVAEPNWLLNEIDARACGSKRGPGSQ